MLKPRQNVIVSTVEPSGADRQKVWLQDKENMFDKNNANIIVAFVDGAGNVNFTDVTTRKSLYIMCKPQTSYTISKIASSCFRMGSCNNIPTVNNRKLINYNTLDGGANITNVSFNTGENANYLVITYYDSETDTLTEQEIIDTIKISDDSKEEKIHILNDNNVYEEFMKKHEEKVILYDNASGSNGNITLLDDAENYDYIEIFFVDNNKHDYSSLRFMPNGENVVLSLQSGYTDSAGLHYTSRFSVFNIKGKSVTSDDTRNGLTNITNNLNIKEIRAGNFIYITKIIGYKD